MKGADVRKVIADAAQRRIDVMNGCASGTKDSQRLAEEASRNGFRTKAEEDDANERAIMQAYIEMIQEEEREKYGQSYIPPSQENPAGPRSTLSPPLVPEHSKPTMAPQPPRSSSDHDTISTTPAANNASYDDAWSCPICTLENPPNFLCCDACGSERPPPTSTSISLKSRPESHNKTANTKPREGKKSSSSSTTKPLSRPASQCSAGSRAFKPRTSAAEALARLERNTPKRPLGWICHVCGTFMETEWWTCASCGTMKQSS